jgi:aminopeptidase
VEHQTEGTIMFEWPQVYNGREVSGIRLVFRDGKVTEARADKGGDFLHEVLETDEGARYLGELGIGCNTGITRYTKNTLFDEKIGGTVHLAIGQAYEECGGRNRSAVHWDLVKDLRKGGRIYLDGQLVQENGEWCF